VSLIAGYERLGDVVGNVRLSGLTSMSSIPSPALSARAAGDLLDAIVDDLGEHAKAAGIDLAG
jgi:hypothetical protein